MTSRVEDLLEGILLEDILDKEGVDYRIGHGSRGEQVILRECPWCGGDDWKTYANRDTGLGVCFHGACEFYGKGWNRQRIVARLLGDASFPVVLCYFEQLAKEIGWRPKRARTIIAETDNVVAWQMPKSIELPTPAGENLAYLEERRIDGALAKRFQLRYCQSGKWRYTLPNGTDVKQDFSNRVLVPVHDLDGSLVTFQGRDLTGHPKARRYLFPLGLPGTASYLFNGYAVTGLEHLVVNEGPFDVIASTRMLAVTRDYRDVGAVGTFGIDLADGRDGADQVHRLIKLKEWGLKRLTFMLDGEPRAWEKAIKMAVRAHSLGLQAWIAALPADKDPDEVDLAAFEAAMTAAQQVEPSNAVRLRLRNPYQ